MTQRRSQFHIFSFMASSFVLTPGRPCLVRTPFFPEAWVKLHSQVPRFQGKGSFLTSFSSPPLSPHSLVSPRSTQTSVCLPYGVAQSPVEQPCAYPGPGGFFILLPVTRLMVSLKSFSPPGCNVSSSGWPSTYFLQVHVSLLEILVPPTHPGWVASPCSTLQPSHSPLPHLHFIGVNPRLSVIPPSIHNDVFGYIPPVPGNDFPPLQMQTHGPPSLPSTFSLLCPTVLRGARKCIWGSFAHSAKLSKYLQCIRPYSFRIYNLRGEVRKKTYHNMGG